VCLEVITPSVKELISPVKMRLGEGSRRYRVDDLAFSWRAFSTLSLILIPFNS